MDYETKEMSDEREGVGKCLTPLPMFLYAAAVSYRASYVVCEKISRRKTNIES